MSSEPIIKTTWRHGNAEITKAFLSGKNVQPELMRKRPCRTDVATNKDIQVTVNGKLYKSVRVASGELNIAESRIYLEMRQKKSRDVHLETGSGIRKRKKKQLLVNGVTYNGYSEASKATGLSHTTLRGRFKEPLKKSVEIK